MGCQNHYVVYQIQSTKFILIIHVAICCNIPRMFTCQCGNHSLRGDGPSLWNKLFKEFFPSHDFTFFFKLKSFRIKRFLQTYKNKQYTSDTRSNNFLLIFSPEHSFMKCSPATKSFNLVTEINKVIYMDIDLYVFFKCLYVYICLYRYVLLALVCACSYLHIFTYSFGSYSGLIRLHFVS